MSTNKTIPTTASVSAFLDARCHPRLRADAETLITLMTDITGCPPVLWGPSIIGFDSYHYRYETGREGDMCALGFSVRQKELVIYLVDGVEKYLPLLGNSTGLRHGKACLYLKDLTQIDQPLLKQILTKSYRYVTARDGNMHRA